MTARLMLDVTEAIIASIGNVSLHKAGKCRSAEIEKKNTRDWDDPVTVVDIDQQNDIARRLSFITGPLGVIGEEQGWHYNKLRTDKPFIETVQSKLHYYRKGIVIDPIDGTKRFRDGKYGWGCMIAMFDGGEYMGAWIVIPKVNGSKVLYDVVSAVAGDRGWNAIHSEWQQDETGQGKAIPRASRALINGRFKDSTCSRKIIIQSSAFIDECKERVERFCEILRDQGYQPIIAANSVSGKDYGSAALDWSALAKGEIAGLMISSAMLHDVQPGQLIVRAAGKTVTDLRGQDFGNQGMFLPDMNWGIMAGDPDAHCALIEASTRAFGDIFAGRKTCTVDRRLFPSARDVRSSQPMP